MSQHDPQGPPHSSFAKRVLTTRWGRLLLALALILLVVGPFALNWLIFRFTHSITDDAFVETHIVNIGPQQVSGHIVKFLVQEHDVVEAGQTLIELDPVPYREQVELLTAKLGVAQAQLEAQKRELEVLQAQVPHEIEIARRAAAAARAEQARDDQQLKFVTQDVEKEIDEARAGLKVSQAGFVLADEDFKRFSKLGREDVVSQRRSEEATKAFNASKADVQLSEAKLARSLAAATKVDVAREAVAAAQQQTQKAERALALAETRTLQIVTSKQLVEVKKTQVEETKRALAVAQTDLNYTKIVAPFPGVIVHLYRHLGDFVPVGTPILSMFNPELTYVTANLEETKLQGVAPGNAVRLDVDAFPEPFRGRVVWINRATGANFALVPRNISSGEFTKVVQRVPVRILIEKDDRWSQLEAGLSVTVSIEHGPGDPAWASQAADAMRALESTVQVHGD
jgi:membrane fusion protein (multidrug efflux system)